MKTSLVLRIVILLLVSCVLSSVALATPSVSGISPTVGPVSPVGSALTINGSGFGLPQSGSTITVGGVTAVPTSWNDTKIVAPVPSSLLPGFADVIVTVNGVASNAKSFLVIPVITAVSPAHAPINGTVTVTGTSFGDTQGTSSTVTLNGLAVSPTAWSNTTVSFPIPVGASSGTIVVTVNGWQTNGVNYYIAPTISGVTPSSGPVGGNITISGSAFGATQNFNPVTIGGTGVAPTSWSDTAITIAVPTGLPPGNADVVVTVNGTSSNTMGFTVTLPGPTISSLNPSNGPTGSAITINGTGFGSVQGSVSIGGANAAITSWTDAQIAVTVPDEALSGVVLVTAQGVASNQATFQISPPVIQSIGFPFGGPGVERTIFGTNFGNIPRQVTMNGVSAQIDVWSNTRISVFIPDMHRTGPVIVSAHGEESNPVTFNFVRAIRAVGNTLNLFITPDEATLIVGEKHRLRLIDAQGVEQTAGVAWSVDDQQVGQIVVDNATSSADILAMTPGIVTITATSSTGTAKAEYTVVGVDSVGPALPLWTVYPETEEGWMFPFYNLKALGSSPDDPYAYLFDTHPRDLPQTALAVRDDGSIKWKAKLNYGFFYVAATNDGGFVVVSDAGPNGDLPQFLRKYSPSDGSLKWENQFSGGIGIPAIAHDDTVYVEEAGASANSVLAINGADGHFTRATAPSSTGTTWNSVESYPNDPNRKPCAGNAIIPTPQASSGDMIGPLVAADGRAYVAVSWVTVSDFEFNDCTWGLDNNTGTNVIFTAKGQYTFSQQASIMSVGPDGSTQTFSLGGASHTAQASYDRFGGGAIVFSDGAHPGVGASTIVPDGNGGVLVTWGASDFNSSVAHISEFSAGSVVQLPDINGDIVATSEDRVFISNGSNISAYSVPSGTLQWSIPAGQVWSATADGGLVVNTAFTDFNFEAPTLTTFDGAGQPVGTALSLPNDSSPLTEEAALVGNNFGAMGLFALSTPFPHDGLGCALPNCNAAMQLASNPGELQAVNVADRCAGGGFDTHMLGSNSASAGFDPTLLPAGRDAALMVPANSTDAAYSDQTTAQIRVHLNNTRVGATLNVVNNANNQWVTISPTTIVANSRDTVVTVTGNGNDTDGLADSQHPFLVVSQNGHPILDAILDLKLKRTVTVGLFKLHPPNGTELPTRAPADTASVEAELVKDLGRQSNTVFTGQVHGIFDQAFDFEDTPGNGLGFDDFLSGSAVSLTKLLGNMSHFTGIQQINAFYVQKFNPPGNHVGLTATGVGPSVIRDIPNDSNDSVQNVTAHELAHHLGASDYTNSQDSNQLMFNNVVNPRHHNPCHLMRSDWQQINSRTPKIASTTINPDNTETVAGTGFGSATGTANYVTSTQTIPLQITSWTDVQIIVVLPPNITGGTVKFATANGQKFP